MNGVLGHTGGKLLQMLTPGAHSERKQEGRAPETIHMQEFQAQRGLVGISSEHEQDQKEVGSVRLAAPAPCMCGWRPQVEARSLYTDGGGDRPSWPGASSRQEPAKEARVDAPSAFSVEIGVITDLNLGMKEWPSSTPRNFCN